MIGLLFEWPADRGRETKMGSAKHLGEVVSINSSIMLLVADAERASKWHGTSNGPVEFEPEGSDWEKALQALHPSTDEERDATKAGAMDGPDGRLFVPVRGVDTELAALSLSISGPVRVDVFAIDGRIVLVEGYYEDREAEAFREAIARAPDEGGTARKVGSIPMPSGKLACFPAPSRGAPFADLAPDDGEHADVQANEVLLDDESGVLVHVAAGTYDVVHESMSGPWGDATRAVLSLVVGVSRRRSGGNGRRFSSSSEKSGRPAHAGGLGVHLDLEPLRLLPGAERLAENAYVDLRAALSARDADDREPAAVATREHRAQDPGAARSDVGDGNNGTVPGEWAALAARPRAPKRERVCSHDRR